MQEEDKIARRRWLLTLLGATGIAGPVLFAILLVVAGNNPGRTNYDPYQNYVSELGIGPQGWLQNLSFILFGVLMVAFAFALWQGMAGKRGFKVGSVLIGIFGLGLLLMGVCHLDSDMPSVGGMEEASWTGIVHLLAFLVAFGSVIPACLIFAKESWQNYRERIYSYYSLLTGVIATSLFLILFVVWPWDSYRGLWQLLLIAVICIWLAVTGTTLLPRLIHGDH